MLPRAATEHYRRQQVLTAAVLRGTRRTWAAMGRGDWDAAWRRVGPRLTVLVAAGQLRSAVESASYVPDVAAEVGIDPESVARVRPSGFAGVASDGRPLDSLLYQSVTTARTSGLDAAGSLAAGERFLEMAVQTQLADAGRAAESVAMTATPAVTGYVRMLNPPSCSRCAVLAGRWYRWNSGFLRHPRCFPAGVVVSGPAVDAATRRWYEGELVVITTAGGEQLPATGNHPVLTDRGWVPANLLMEGDNVVRGTGREGAVPLVVPHEHQVPSCIEDLWRPDRMVALGEVPTAAEDFHGDGGYGKVDVVLADRLLWNDAHATSGELAEQEQFAGTVAEPLLFAQLGTPDERVQGLSRAADGVMGGGGLLSALVSGHATSAHLASAGAVSRPEALFDEALADRLAAHVVAEAERVLALAGAVCRRDLVGGQREDPPRWDAPAGPFTMESRGGYASRGEDLRLRLSGQVALDRVVDVRRVEWSGHVYNLTSVEGWYSANGLIVSNCDCRHIPAAEDMAGDLTTDPYAYFRSLSSKDQARIFTEDGAQAIRDGADIYQVVNAHRTAAGLTTLEGVQRRTGWAAERLHGGPLPRGARPSMRRLSPEGIYELASDRDEALRLLQRHGYITGYGQHRGGVIRGQQRTT